MSSERSALSYRRSASRRENPDPLARHSNRFSFPFRAQISWAKGVGALYINRRTRFRPLIAGGSQENGRRGGTENVASIVGLGKAAEQAAKYLEEGKCSIRSFRNRFEKSVLENVNGASVNGAGAPRIPNTSSFSFEGIDSCAALLLLHPNGSCCSAASGWRTGSRDPSRVRRAS